MGSSHWGCTSETQWQHGLDSAYGAFYAPHNRADGGVPLSHLGKTDLSSRAIREELFRRDLVDAIIALPPNTFTGFIATCVLVMRRTRAEARKGRVILVDAGALERLAILTDYPEFKMDEALPAGGVFPGFLRRRQSRQCQRTGETKLHLHPKCCRCRRSPWRFFGRVASLSRGR